MKFEVIEIHNGFLVIEHEVDGYLLKKKSHYCAHSEEATSYVRAEILRNFKDVQV